MAEQGTLFIGIGGHVLAIDRATGAERWRCKVRFDTLVTIAIERDAIYAGAAGELFCIDPATGTIRWRNQLTGLGIAAIAFGGPSSTVLIDAEERRT